MGEAAVVVRRGIQAAVLVLTLVIPASPSAGTEDRLLGRRLKDVALTALVKARLVAARPANVARIDVDTDEGVVRLRGVVPGPAEWADAQRLAAETPGVRQVRNELRLEGEVNGGPRT
jgi:osmotically-inducible protein OsmY